MSNKKKGRVIRVTPDLQAIIEVEQKRGETIPEVLRRLLNLKGEVRYVLPSDIHETVEDARGVAVLRAVKTKSKRAERPTAVRVKE
jgi:negative regulator of replication initiation